MDEHEAGARQASIELSAVARARRETAVLLQSVRLALGTGGMDAVRPLCEDVDWNRVVNIALQHGVMPLLHQSLTASCPDRVPAPVRERLRALFRANALRNLFLTGELLEILAQCDSHDIQAVPLKGPVLAMAAYGSVALRQFSDIDIVVRSHDVDRVKELLLARGYSFHSPGETFQVAVRSCSEGRITVDLQWALGQGHYRFPTDVERVWRRLSRMPIGEATVWQPAPADQMMILCGHAAKHTWSRLGWISDIAAFTKAQEERLDWQRIVEDAGHLGGQRLLLVGLRLAADMLGTTVPTDVRSRMHADSVVNALSIELRERLFASAGESSRRNGSDSWLERGFLYIKSRERLRDKWPYSRHLLMRSFRRLKTFIGPSDTDRAFVALPGYAGFLYYVVRPIRVFKEYRATRRRERSPTMKRRSSS